jgi:hypothetical protein
MSAERAADWVARWEAQAATEVRSRDGAYWDAGYVWIVAPAVIGGSDPPEERPENLPLHLG